MADPIEFEWYGPVEGNDALLRDLQRFTERYGEAAIFVRRLSWVPLNYPCQIDDGVAFPAERILEQTSEDLQVLCGYWTDVVDQHNKDIDRANEYLQVKYRISRLTLPTDDMASKW